jgi:hypothetical protein
VGGGLGVGVRPRRGVFCRATAEEEASLSLIRVPEPGVPAMLREERAMARWMGRR